MNKSYLFLATGFEEIEAVTVIDIMRRAGLDIKTVSISDEKVVTGAHGIPVKADLLFNDEDMSQADWLIVPGGMPGAKYLSEFELLNDLLKKQDKRGGKIAAICAAPAVVLAPLGILKDKEATCYPGFENACLEGGAIFKDLPVVSLNNLVTGNGPASAMKFALAIVANELGENVAQEVGSGLLFFTRPVNLFL